MKETKTSVFSNGLIWFGAAISIAEIMTGTLFAPLGFGKGLLAIFIGHVIGCILLYCAGIIGANTKKSAMETVKMSFGQKGSYIFSSLNVLQLIGWTAVMIFSGSVAAQSIISFNKPYIWSLVIGAMIVLWIIIGLKNLGKVNVIAVGGLFVLTIVLSVVILKGNSTYTASAEAMSFGAAVELSVAMPLSWLPLISDYTRMAKEKKKSTIASALVYFLGSSYMYLIGMGAAILTGESDIAKILVEAGLGTVGLLIVLFSTVTTTFLDVYSAGVSSVSINKRINEKIAAIVICVIGTGLAIWTPITKFEDFLYLIGSVFAPMIAIQISDYFIIKKDYSDRKYNIKNLAIWLIGFIIYRIFMRIDTVIGSTIPAMIIVILICYIINVFMKGKKEND